MSETIEPLAMPERGTEALTGEATVQLSLTVAEPELVAELLARAEGEARNRFALSALRIGILTLKQAEGRLDAETIRHESERLLASLAGSLDQHQKKVAGDVAGSLEKYFDPRGGRFSERIERLIAKDGELERFMHDQVGPEHSSLARTLAAHLGEHSPIMKTLSPADSEGFLAALAKKVDAALAAQREAILAEFTLDCEDSALSRLVKRVESSQGEVAGEFSLDNEKSALARMKRELVEVLAEHKKAADDFRAEVSSKLADMTARREEARSSPRHGAIFENALRDVLTDESQKVGDVAQDTSNTTGLIKNCKVGDVVIRLGPDSAAPGACIVVEAKEKERYALQKALEEIERGRKNRGASVGLFVFSKTTAPEGLDPMKRYGSDIVVVWDPEKPETDVYLAAALTVARAICTQEATAGRGTSVDFEPAEKAILAVEKLSKGLDQIRTNSETIQSGVGKILDRVRIMDAELHRQVGVLKDALDRIRAALPGEDA
ncbi:MAG: hypothetical protein ACYS47_06975 [Planctomycetota bacterium]|jgi:hypothetical protein